MPASEYAIRDRAIPMAVLLVEDEREILEEMLEFFAFEGIPAIGVADAAHARQILIERQPHFFSVIVSDIKMAGEDGLSLASSILLSMTEANATEVVLVTGNGTLSVALEALRVRVFDFLPKPLHLPKLVDTVRRAHAAAVMRRHRAEASTGEAVRLRAMLDTLSEKSAAMSGEVARMIDGANADFFRTVEDELRNPLVPVLGFAELIQDNAAALSREQMAEYAGMIRKAGQQLTEQIDAILTITALRRGGLLTAKRTVKADSVLLELARRHEALAQEHGQSIDVRPAPDIFVVTDRRHLVMALDQLVINAIRFGPRDQVVGLAAQAAGGEVQFIVTDQGPGMASGEQENLRKPFQRGDMSLTRATRGLGLGLTLADALSSALSGRLTLDGAPSGGTVAIIAIPNA